MGAIKPTSIKYVEDFAFDLTSKDALSCTAVDVRDNVLRGLITYTKCSAQSNFDGLIGIDSGYCYLQTSYGVAKYNISLSRLSESPFLGAGQPSMYYTMYRHKPYVAVLDVGLFRFDGDRSALLVEKPVISVAAAGERIAVLSDNGLEIQFGDSGTEDVSISKLKLTQSIDLETECQVLHTLGNNVIYALGPTCYKITMSDNLADIKLQKIACGLSAVASHSAATIGDSIVFASYNGLYQLKNDKVTRIFKGLDNVIGDYKSCRAGIWRDYYTLSIYCNGNRRALVLDVDKQECVGVLYDGVRDVQSYGNRHFMVFNDGSLNADFKNIYHSARYVRSNIDFDVTERKYLRRLNITTKKDVDVYVTDDCRTRCIHVKGGKAMRSVPLSGQGHAFTLDIRSKGEMEITRLELIADIYKEAQYVGN